MPRRKKDTLMPLPNELEPKQHETKVEIALQKVKESKKKQPIVIDYETDDDEPEYTIEPIRAIQPAPVLPPPPPIEVVKEEPPVKKEKRKYTKKVKPPPVEPTQPAPSFNPLDIYKQLDTLKRENDRLKTEQSLSHINRLNNMARVMKIKF